MVVLPDLRLAPRGFGGIAMNSNVYSSAGQGLWCYLLGASVSFLVVGSVADWGCRVSREVHLGTEWA